MKRDETYVHIAIRKYLKSNGWLLIAGQFPGGSDDELHIFNVVDPELAKDDSPDHRRHSFGKFVPDLIAFKNNELIAIEAKPEYSASDEEKIKYLLTNKRQDFLRDLNKFIAEKDIQGLPPLEGLKIIPALAFLSEYSAPNDNLAHLKVVDLDTVITENFQP